MILFVVKALSASFAGANLVIAQHLEAAHRNGS
jgi:hypothetical protein